MSITCIIKWRLQTFPIKKTLRIYFAEYFKTENNLTKISHKDYKQTIQQYPGSERLINNNNIHSLHGMS